MQVEVEMKYQNANRQVKEGVWLLRKNNCIQSAALHLLLYTLFSVVVSLQYI